eukprot:403372782
MNTLGLQRSKTMAKGVSLGSDDFESQGSTSNQNPLEKKRNSAQPPTSKAMNVVNMFKVGAKKLDKTEEVLKKHGYLPDDNSDQMENVQQTNDYYNKIKYLEFSTFFFAWIGLGVSIVEYELRYISISKGTLTESKQVQLMVMLCINLFCTISTAISILSRYLLIIKWEILKKILLPLDDLFTTKQYKSYILELISVALSPYPGLQDATITEVYIDRDITNELNVNVLLLCCALIIRLYLAIRFILSFTSYRNSRMQRLCHINGTNANFMFALKCMKNDQPYIFISFSLVIPLIICGYGLRMFERPLMATSMFNFDDLGNCIWCIIITMATVGYGDYFPISNFGRIIGIMACLWGVFITAIMVVTLNNLLEFKRQESKSYEILCKLAYKDMLRANAVSVILSAQKQKMARQKDDLNISNLSVVFRDFKKNVFSLKQISKKIRGLYEDYNEVELVTKDVEELNQEVNLILEVQAQIFKDFKEFQREITGSEASKTNNSSQATHDDINNTNSILESEDLSDIDLSEKQRKELFVPNNY